MSASVSLRTRPIWRIRLGRELPRYALYALSLWGVLASARYAIAPPRPVIRPAPHAEVADRAAEAFASLFARRYLTWNATQPQAYEESLASFLGAGAGEQAGVQLPPSGSEEAQWVQVVQERRGALGQRVYTLACQTNTAGLLYLTVGVLRKPSGALALAGYPAFVGAPASSTAENVLEGFPNVEDGALAVVAERALRNYLDDSPSELAADLTESAQVSLPGLPLTLDALEQLKWLPGGGSLFAVAQASDRRGARYTLTYELDVVEVAGRWEISAIQMNPYA
jgi:Conjugative transposon protein TcpC